MARTNKYASLNFNEIYEKKVASSTTTTTISSSGGSRYISSPGTHPGKSYSSVSSRSHGMLLLSRPSPKPHPKTQSQAQTQPENQPPPSLLSPTKPPQSPPPTLKDQPRSDPNSISLRPQGKSGPGPLISSPLWSPNTVPEEGEKGEVPQTSPKSGKFVPPHLRPGFAAKEGRPATPPGGGKGGYRHGGLGLSSPNRCYADDERPKSGGGYDRAIGRRGEVVDRGFYPDGSKMMMQNRPRSGGIRPGLNG